MIGYVTLGTNNFERSTAFYEELLKEVGASRFMNMPHFIAWGTAPNRPMLAIAKPFNKEDATYGNGTMVALHASSKEQVDAIHKKALELGATDEGAPGPRGAGGFYAGYFRDQEGNKLNAFYMG